MLTFTDTPVTKMQLVGALEGHRARDAIVQGVYWQEGRGCAVGCSLHDFGGDPALHKDYERLFGVPRLLARLEDGIFEGLPLDVAKDWPVRFAKALPEGRDLALVWPRFAVWLLVDPDCGVIKHAKTDLAKKAIQDVADAYSRAVKGEVVAVEEWQILRAAVAAVAAAVAAAYAVAAAAVARHQLIRRTSNDRDTRRRLVLPRSP